MFQKMSVQITLILWIIFVVIVNSKNDEFYQIQTKNGLIRGLHETSQRKHVDFYAFRGIPYAKAPLNELRFKVSMTFIKIISNSWEIYEKSLFVLRNAR